MVYEINLNMTQGISDERKRRVSALSDYLILALREQTFTADGRDILMALINLIAEFLVSCEAPIETIDPFLDLLPTEIRNSMKFYKDIKSK